MILSLLGIGVVKLLSISLTLLMIAVIVQAILSWFRPNTMFEPILNVITSPFIKPLQRRIPPAGGVDLSAFVLIVIIQLLQMLPIYYLDRLVRSLI
jgi:YggT family protein